MREGKGHRYAGFREEVFGALTDLLAALEARIFGEFSMPRVHKVLERAKAELSLDYGRRRNLSSLILWDRGTFGAWPDERSTCKKIILLFAHITDDRIFFHQIQPDSDGATEKYCSSL